MSDSLTIREEAKMGPSYMNEKTNYRPLKDRTQNLFILFIALGTFLSCASFKHFAHEGTERDAWQLPARVIHSLGIQPGDYVADLGCLEAVILQVDWARRWDPPVKCMRWMLMRK